jgi:hypothetical protein
VEKGSVVHLCYLHQDSKEKERNRLQLCIHQSIVPLINTQLYTKLQLAKEGQLLMRRCAQVDGGFIARSGGDWLNNSKSRKKKKGFLFLLGREEEERAFSSAITIKNGDKME